MVQVLVRGLSPHIHHVPVSRAQQRGQSLPQYLAAELTRLAVAPTLDDVLDRIATRLGGSVGLKQAATDLADERTGR